MICFGALLDSGDGGSNAAVFVGIGRPIVSEVSNARPSN